MFIVWGTKVVRKSIGRVADFCYICRDFRPFRGMKIESVGHLYYIPLGSRKTLAHNRTCESCGSAFNMKPESYHGLSRDRHAGLDRLIAETNPRAVELWKDRIQVENRAREGRLAADERRSYILEPFLLLNYRVEERTSGIHVDRYGVLALLVAIALPILAMASLNAALRPAGEIPTQAAVGSGLLGLALFVWALATQARRYVRRQVLPAIVEALRPLNPSSAELDAALQHLKQMQMPIGQILRPVDIRDAFGWGTSKPAYPELAA